MERSVPDAANARPWRVVAEILVLSLEGDGAHYQRLLRDLSGRDDVIHRRTPISAAVREAFEAAHPGHAGSADPSLIVHSTSWRQAPDGTLVLTWAVVSNHLRLGPGHGVVRGRELGLPETGGSAAPPEDPTLHAVAVHAARHIGHLARHDPAVREALGEDRHRLALWSRVRGSVARDLTAPAAGMLRQASPNPGGAGWQVLADVYTLELGAREARYVEDLVDLTEDAAVRERRASVLDRVAGRFRERFPGSPADRSLVACPTSWRQAEDGSLRLHWMLVPRSVDLSGEPDVRDVRLDRVRITTADDATAPDAVRRRSADGIVGHGLESLGAIAREDPGVAAALAAVPGRAERLRRLAIERRPQAPRREAPGAEGRTLG